MAILLLLTKTLFPTMEIIDWANDFVINLLLQGIISDADFRNGISTLISQLQDGNPATTIEQRKVIVSKVLYYQSNPVFLVPVTYKSNCRNQSCYDYNNTRLWFYQIQKQNILSLLSLLTTLQLILAIKDSLQNHWTK